MRRRRRSEKAPAPVFVGVDGFEGWVFVLPWPFRVRGGSAVVLTYGEQPSWAAPEVLAAETIELIADEESADESGPQFWSAVHRVVAAWPEEKRT